MIKVEHAKNTHLKKDSQVYPDSKLTALPKNGTCTIP